MAMQSFDDLLRALREHPEWRQELRRELLTDELLALPQLVRELAEAQTRTEAQLEALTARVDTLSARVEALAEAQTRTEARLQALTARVEALAEAQTRTEARLQALTARLEELAEIQKGDSGRIGWLQGRAFERDYIDHAFAYFDDLLRKIRILPKPEIAALLDQAPDRVSQEERKQVLAADLVLHGRRLADQTETYLLGEISIGIGIGDVERAAQRARILARATQQPAIPAVGGREIHPAARNRAAELGVSVFLDGGLQAQ